MNNDTINALQVENISDSFDPFQGPQLLYKAPATEPQKEIWTSCQQSVHASLGYNESITLTLFGALNIDALIWSVQQIFERHEALRSTFSTDGTEFCITEPFTLNIPSIDLSSLPMDEAEKRVKEEFAAEVNQPFDLIQGPLFRAKIIKRPNRNEQEHSLVLTAHHIVCDGWSYGVIVSDLAKLYSARVNHQSYPSSSHRFLDYVESLSFEDSQHEQKRSEAYWVKKFENTPPSLDLPTDHLRTPDRTFRSKRFDFNLSKDVIRLAKLASAKNGCSLLHFLLASFSTLLSRITGQEDIIIGIPTAGQASSGFQSLVGHCVNTIPIHSKCRAESSFLDHLKSTRATVFDALDHQNFTYGELLQKIKVSRDPSRPPFISVLFNLDQKIDVEKINFEGLKLQFHSNPRDFEIFELFINMIEHPGGLTLEVQYQVDLFHEETLSLWMSLYQTVIEAAISKPDTSLAYLPILPLDLQKKIVCDWNSSSSTFNPNHSWIEQFQAQAIRSPNSTAVCFENQTLTYRELDTYSNQIAHELQTLGAGPQTLVGIAVERSLEMLLALLGTLKTGAGYVPLDPTFPKERLNYMMSDSQISILVDHHKFPLDSEASNLFHGKRYSFDVNRLTQREHPPRVSIHSEDTAYVIYTSGSTGKPKGVQVPHRAITNLLLSMLEQPGIHSSDVLVAVTTLSFDIAALELFLPLVAGATVVIAAKYTSSDGSTLLDLLQESKATVMQATPTTWRMLLDAGWKGTTSNSKPFKVLVGGEAVPRELVNQLLNTTTTVWNMYGPTETTVWSTCNPIQCKEGPVSIGRPIRNTQVYILDSRLQLLPPGIAGEIYIGGTGVAHGYYRNPELTSERFLENPYFDPFAEYPAPKLYRTGDLGRFLVDGNIEYLRRNDHQVKVRGYRIELGEIEGALLKYPEIDQCVVLVAEDSPSDSRIVACIISKSNQSLDINRIRRHLKSQLPAYMIPQTFLWFDEFPKTQNGKIDRIALAQMQSGSNSHLETQNDSFVEPRSKAEIIIATIWKELLKIEKVGIHDNFYNLGGHSLLGMQFISKLMKKTGYKLNPRNLILNSLEQIASQISEIPESPPKTETQVTGFTRTLIHQIKSNLMNKSSSENLIQDGAIKRRKNSHQAPTTHNQTEIWNFEQKNSSIPLNHLPTAFRLKGALDIDLFEQCLQAFINRHEVLRSSFKVQGKELSQITQDSVTLKLKRTNLPNADEASLLRILNEEITRPFDLSKELLIRFQLIQISPEQHILFVMPHHIIWDAWCFDLFLKELSCLYEARSLSELPYQFGDYAIWKNMSCQTQLEKERLYWRTQLDPLPSRFNLPTDYPRQARNYYRTAALKIKLEKSLSDSLNEFAKKQGSTLGTLLLSVYNALLFRRTGQKDVVVGLSVQGRDQLGTQDILGHFVNTLPVRVRLSESAPSSFNEIIRRTQESQFGAFENQSLPLSLIVKETPTQEDSPLFHTAFSFQDATQRRTQLAHLTLGDQIYLHSGFSRTELSLWLKSTQKGLIGEFLYCVDLFKAATIKDLAEEYTLLLQALLKDGYQNYDDLKFPDSGNNAFTLTDSQESPVSLLKKTSSHQTNQPFFFSWQGKRLLGLYHPPQGQNLRNSAVLLCNPIGQEYIRSHWSLKQLAQTLAKAGFPVLRFDYFGMGDSEGETEDGNIAEWVSNTEAAAKQLSEISETETISIVGLRLGASIAYQTPFKDHSVQNIILWDPVIHGKTYLMELARLHEKLLAGDPFYKNLNTNEILEKSEFVGFPHSLLLRDELERMNLMAIKPPRSKKIWMVASHEREEFLRLQSIQRQSRINYVLTPDKGDWDSISTAHLSLLAPKIHQSILTILQENT